MEIIEFDPAFTAEAKDLLAELQSYLVALDKRGVLTMRENYRDEYFEYVAHDIDKHEGKIFIAVKDGRAVGLVVCKILRGGDGETAITTTCPTVGIVSDLVVTEKERGHGIGTGLIDKAEEYFSAHGCEYTQLEVFAPNTNAISLYKKYGFEPLVEYMSKRTGH